MVKVRTVGEVTIYGYWDDCSGHEFAVIWGESGPFCTVLMFSGQDYGGGVGSSSCNVPVNEAQDIVKIEDDYERYRDMAALVELYP